MNINMKNLHLYMSAALTGMFMLAGCASPDYVDPTADRQGITSLTAYFTSGTNSGKEAVAYSIDNSTSITDYVIPVPYYYPEESDSTTEKYMKAMKVVAVVENNCMIDPPITVLDLTKKNQFTYTDPYGNSKAITISGQMTKSSKCAIKAFMASPGDLNGVVDEDSKTISLVTTADLSECTAEVTLSPHATISPDPAEVHNFNSDFQFTVTADNGTSKAVYTVKKQVPSKIDNGYRKGSKLVLFSKDIASTYGGVTTASEVHPTLAMAGNYLVVDYGNGSTPFYVNKMTGVKLGDIAMGAANASGCVASDLNGNMLICNAAESGSTLKMYRTNSVTTAPTLYLTYDNATGLTIGNHVHIQGDLDKNAIISATLVGLYAQHFVRWIVTDGKVGEPELVATGAPQWSGLGDESKVVSYTTKVADGYFLGNYESGDKVYYLNGNNAIAQSLSYANGSAWGYANNSMDVREFNNAKYLSLYQLGYFPGWGMNSTMFLYDVSSPSNLAGDVESSSSLKDRISATIYTTVADPYSAEGDACGPRTSDILMVPSADGYFLYIYYIDNTNLGLGGVQYDCIDK